jgi:hypothetical protein
VWHEIVRIRKSKYGLSKFIKIKNGHWKLYHVYIWEINHGVITKDHYLRFIDGDMLNCSIENLKLMPKNNVLNSDRKIATDMARKNPALRDELLKHPELIELKRAQQQLTKTIHDTEIS